MYDNPEVTVNWFVCSFINIITRFSVPCFVMISGSLILNSENNISAKNFYKRASYKIFLPAFVIHLLGSLIKAVTMLIKGGTVIESVRLVYSKGLFGSWYIYMLAGLYFLSPLIIRLKKSMSDRGYTYLAIFFVVWAVVSQSVSNQNKAYSIGTIFAFCGYYLLGDVIHRSVRRIKVKSIVIVVVSLFCVCLSFVFRFFGYNYYTNDALKAFFSPAICIYSVCMFVLFSRLIWIKIDSSWLSNKTYYAFLLHGNVINALWAWLGNKINTPIVGIGTISILAFVIAVLFATIFDIVWRGVTIKAHIKDFWFNLNIWKLLDCFQ